MFHMQQHFRIILVVIFS